METLPASVKPKRPRNMQDTANLLRSGDRGSEVVKWQNALRAAGYTGVKASGLFDSLTQAATRDWQFRTRIRVDGIVGPESRNAMGMTIGISNAPGSRSYTRQEAEDMGVPISVVKGTRKTGPMDRSPILKHGDGPSTPAWLKFVLIGGALYLGYEAMRGT